MALLGAKEVHRELLGVGFGFFRGECLNEEADPIDGQILHRRDMSRIEMLGASCLLNLLPVPFSGVRIMTIQFSFSPESLAAISLFCAGEDFVRVPLMGAFSEEQSNDEGAKG